MILCYWGQEVSSTLQGFESGASVDVIFEGRLNQETGIREVLQQVFDQAHTGRTILRLSALKDDFAGRILISSGRHVVAASVGENQVLGYPALKMLLDRQDLSFALLRVSPNDNLDLGTTLNIDLMRIIALLPDLPDSPAGLFDEKGLLDRVFGDFDDTPVGPSEPRQMGPPATIIQSASERAAFDMLEPFLTGGGPQGDDDYDDEDDRPEIDFTPAGTPSTPLPAIRPSVKTVPPPAMQENSTKLRQLAKPPKQEMRIPYVPISSCLVIYLLFSITLAYLRPVFAEPFSWSYSWASIMWDHLAPNRIGAKQQSLNPSTYSSVKMAGR